MTADTLDRHRWLEYASPALLAEALAERVAGALQGAIEAKGTATLAVSGGTTPGPFFTALSRQKIAWEKVTLTLVDERFVPPSSERSNERLARGTLLQGPAAAARFVPLFSAAGNVDAASIAAEKSVGALPRPLDVAVLGMGGDGHTASFFPDAPNLPELLSNPAGRLVLPVIAPSAGEPRLTLSMQLLAGARLLILHIEGGSKRDMLVDALEAPPADAPPIRQLFETSQEPVHVFWAP